MRKIIGLYILLLSSGYSHAQTNIDKIIAKVDNYYILKSEVEELVGKAKQNNQPIEPCQALENLAIQKLLVAKAEIDSVIVEEGQISKQLDSRMNEMSRLYGSEKAIIQQFGKSIETLKSELRSNIKEQMTAQQMQQNIIEKIKITPEEVKTFYNKIPKDSLPIVPTEVKLSQIVRLGKVTKAQRDELIAKLKNIKKQIEEGADFAEMAKKYSEDVGSAEQGGDLGYTKRGVMVPEFEATAINIQEAEVSDVIESEFGYHLIQTLEKRGQEYHARHILLRPDYNRLDLEKPKTYLDSLKNGINVNNLTFEKAVKLNSEDKHSVDSGGIITDEQTGTEYLPLDASMEPNLYFTIEPMKIGDISKPINYRTVDGKTGMRILKVINRVDAHKINLEQDYEKLRNFALVTKQNEAIEKWFKDAIAEVYINIDPEYQSCHLFGIQ